MTKIINVLSISAMAVVLAMSSCTKSGSSSTSPVAPSTPRTLNATETSLLGKWIPLKRLDSIAQYDVDGDLKMSGGNTTTGTFGYDYMVLSSNTAPQSYLITHPNALSYIQHLSSGIDNETFWYYDTADSKLRILGQPYILIQASSNSLIYKSEVVATSNGVKTVSMIYLYFTK